MLDRAHLIVIGVSGVGKPAATGHRRGKATSDAPAGKTEAVSRDGHP